mgnify:CR=1 FL=1
MDRVRHGGLNFSVYWVDLRDNGKRNINKYQPMFEKENDLKALYAETNEDWHAHWTVAFSVLLSYIPSVVRMYG